jgi:hypothetical protein
MYFVETTKNTQKKTTPQNLFIRGTAVLRPKNLVFMCKPHEFLGDFGRNSRA